MRLLYFSPSSYGGLADYAHHQAQALAEEGVEVAFLCGPDFPEYPRAHYTRRPLLHPHRSSSATKAGRAWHMARTVIQNHHILGDEVRNGRHSLVLFGAYAEYFSPFWTAQLKRLRRVRWGAVVHDPVRDTALGPSWWHRRSVATAYSLLQIAFVHEQTTLGTGLRAPNLKTVVIPHGPYTFPTTGTSCKDARRRLNLPEDATVLLLFGHIRDGKNLDLVLDILPAFPGVHLVVAGKEQSNSQRPIAFYQNRARKNGVSDRCHWYNRHIPKEEVECYFAASNFLLLPYSKQFRSASGVLNASVQFRLPCLATSGDGPLRSLVHEYNLGIWRPADDRDALKEGLTLLLRNPPQPQWERYAREHAWKKNACGVIDAFQHPSVSSEKEGLGERQSTLRLNQVTPQFQTREGS